MFLLFTLLASTLFLAHGLVDVIGYYGNSGNAVSFIPLLRDIDSNYNVLIITFINFDASGSIIFEIQGPYEKDIGQLASDVATWKSSKDKFGRQKYVLASLGGQNGRWPSGVTAEQVESSLREFLEAYNLDGFDIDLESSSISGASTLIPVVKQMTQQGYTVTAAPEAAQGPLDAYAPLLQYLTWVHPQFYNNPPNAVTTPYVPTDWPSPWTVSDWQAENGERAFWAAVLSSIASATGLSQEQQGMLIPATPSAASNHNHWDIDRLKTQVLWAKISHVGTWAIAYDHQNNWQFAATMGSLNQALLADQAQSTHPRNPHNPPMNLTTAF